MVNGTKYFEFELQEIFLILFAWLVSWSQAHLQNKTSWVFWAKCYWLFHQEFLNSSHKV